jgi:uncharacterized spore protein YtfJ
MATEPDEAVERILGPARDALTVKRVFGEAYESEGCLVVPVAAIRGGGGGGGGRAPDASTGSGAGFGLSARPVGVYRIKGDQVTWVPAADTTRVILVGQLVGIVALLVLRSIVRRVTGRH